MRGISFVNNNNVKVEAGTGPILLGHLDLDPGSYLLWEDSWSE